MSDDLVDRLLGQAGRNGVLQASALDEVARGLREQARIILDGRVHELEERVAALERELAQHRAQASALAEEKETLVRRVLGHLDQLGKSLGWGARRARDTLATLTIALRKELP